MRAPSAPPNDHVPIHDMPKIGRAFGVVGVATLTSRLLGYLRDMAMASFFGAGMVADAFLVAFIVPNLLRRLFAEGVLSSAFVPVYSDHIARFGRAEADRLAGSAARLLLLVLSVATLMGIVLAPELIDRMVMGWSETTGKYTLCVKLTRLMLPYLIFIGLAALGMGVLNVLGHFAAPALSPALLNVAMIAALAVGWFASSDPQRQIQFLALGVTCGGALQLVALWPFLKQRGVPLLLSGPLWHPRLKRVLLLMGPVFFGSALFQVNGVVARLLASLLPEGSVACLYYADRLIELPLGVFGIAAATAVMPTLSHQAAMRRWNGLRLTFCYAMRLVFFVTIPAMAGLIVLRHPIVTLLLQRGAFDPHAAQATADAVLFYGVGLWAFAAERIMLNTFYALQCARTPLVVGVAVMAAHILLAVLLMKPLGPNGLALALALASSLNFVALAWLLQRRVGALGWRKVAVSAGKSSAAALVMGLILYAIQPGMVPLTQGRGPFILAMEVGSCIILGIAVYGLLTWLFRSDELFDVLNLIFNRKNRP